MTPFKKFSIIGETENEYKVEFIISNWSSDDELKKHIRYQCLVEKPQNQNLRTIKRAALDQLDSELSAFLSKMPSN